MSHRQDPLFEQEIRHTLHQMSEALPEDDRLLHKIQTAVKEEKERRSMKKLFSSKKFAALAASALILIGGLSYAAGNISHWISVSNNTNSYTGIMPEAVIQKELGKVPKYIESFANGFAIEESNIAETTAYDENNQNAGETKELYLSYKRGDARLTLNILPNPAAIGMTTEPGADTALYKDITLSYSKDPFKFVPPDYKATEEELRLAEEGKLNLSYGSSEIETGFHSFLSWIEDGSSYQLLTEEELSREELIEMAKEVIDSK